MNNEATDKQKEMGTMTNYYLTIARHFLSSTVLAGFGATLAN
jgi:hypothetical protein